VVRGYLSEIFTSYQGEGIHAGRRHLFVRMGGCNLRCRYCDTPDSLERVASYRIHNPDGSHRDAANPVSAATALSDVLTLLDGAAPLDGVAITGGEPLLQPAFLAEFLADARLPRPRLLETNGMLPESLREVLPVVDVVSMDIKLPSNSGERAFWAQHERFLAVAEGKAYVKVLVDGGTDAAEVARAAAVVHDTAPATPVFLQPITDAAGRLDTDAIMLDRFFAAARRHVDDVRVLPQAHKALAIR
jgi:organic radical activating enzyme